MSAAPSPHGRERGAHWLLVAGAAGGMALAVMSLMSAPDSGPLPTGLVARVNGVAIRAPQFERAVEALAADRRMPLTEADRRYVLDRLIDEELLVQYGLSLGLARSDRRIRGDFVTSVIAAQVASVDGTEPADGEARDFFRENRDFFSSPPRLWARSLWVRGAPVRSPEAALARAREATQRLRSGEAFQSVESELGDPLVAALPDAPLPPAKLREYVGPAALAALAPLDVGGVSEPVVSVGGVRVMVLVAREATAAPEFDEVEAEVRNEMKRRAGDTAIRRLLGELREGGEVEVAEVLP